MSPARFRCAKLLVVEISAGMSSWIRYAEPTQQQPNEKHDISFEGLTAKHWPKNGLITCRL